MSIPKRHVTTEFGDIAYSERGSGPTALFVHGVFVNGYLWRHVIERVADLRRCVAIDLLAHGATRTAPGQDLSFTGQAQMLEAFCRALDIEQVDLIGNDSGGGIAQIFAARHPERIRSLTLTNCDTHDNWPPPAFDATRAAIARGRLKSMVRTMLADLGFACTSFGSAYEHPERLDAETVREYIGPLASDEALAHLERWFAAD
ncbi:MAG TPA: alpha/beta fold hydrolase, partial [Polyangiales bacterium]|nr:alpha/beta fold hydrolase [Polyangiales bacterium]